MNQTQATPLNTATAVGAGAVVAPVVSYVASAFHIALPADVQGSIVVLLVAGAHWLGQQIAARNAVKPATPAA
jgi:hypothetical protein